MDKGVALGVRQSDREEPLEAERVPVATGRTPNTKGLGLAEAGVAQTRNGGIEVDERMRTTRPGTYAAVDVPGVDPFVYRTEEPRVGKECDSTCRSRGAP